MVYRKIVKYFSDDKSAIRGLYDEKKVLEKLKTHKKAATEDVLKETLMPDICWQKIEKEEEFTREEVRKVLKQLAKSEQFKIKTNSLDGNFSESIDLVKDKNTENSLGGDISTITVENLEMAGKSLKKYAQWVK